MRLTLKVNLKAKSDEAHPESKSQGKKAMRLTLKVNLKANSDEAHPESKSQGKKR